MLIFIYFYLTSGFSAPLCTVKVDIETLKAKQVVQTYKFKNKTVKQCKRKAMRIQTNKIEPDVRFKFVSWEWRGKKKGH